MAANKIIVLLIEDNKDFAKLVQVYLHRYEKDRFQIIWKENYTDAMSEVTSNKQIDVVLMDYFLPGKNGLEITKEIKERKINLPIIFLTVNKDFDLALEVMKLGVEDYLVKEEISSPVLPRTVLGVMEKHKLKDQLMELEIKQQRLDAIHKTLEGVISELDNPFQKLNEASEEIKGRFTLESQKNYVRIIVDNISRISEKLGKLKSLKTDKTVPYIKDIKMIDIS